MRSSTTSATSPSCGEATVAEIAEVEGMDGSLATAVKETLDRITDSSILDQYA